MWKNIFIISSKENCLKAQSQYHKGKMNKMKNFYLSQDNIKRAKKQATEQQRIIAIDKTNQGHIQNTHRTHKNY